MHAFVLELLGEKANMPDTVQDAGANKSKNAAAMMHAAKPASMNAYRTQQPVRATPFAIN